MCRMLKYLPAAGVVLLVLLACNLASGTPPTPPARNAPRITFQFPQNGSNIIEGTDLRVDLVAEDEGGGVARVELLVDDLQHQEGRPVENIAVPVFTVTMNWMAQGAGLHSLTAIAYRADGTASDPAVITVQVLPRPTDPAAMTPGA
jgi:hypothetical protein